MPKDPSKPPQRHEMAEEIDRNAGDVAGLLYCIAHSLAHIADTQHRMAGWTEQYGRRPR